MYRYVITLGELKKLQKQGNVRLVDVREPERYEKGHIPEAESIPYSEEPDFLEKFEKKNAIVICCDRGNLSAKVTLRMRKAGYPAYSLAGGYEGYKRFQK
ncbi:MAG: rhodanese-like domain-containing protein [Lachnospiraceae bacterium]|nr:rhodanese-like domain-containing protein [Lachnospiraceae bacterium]